MIAGLPPERLPELSLLLDQALDLDPAARPAWIAGLTGSAVELAPVLLRLLDPATAPITERFLAALPDLALEGDAGFSTGESVLLPGMTIGPYRLERELGCGGMGDVWLAARNDGAFQRQVALKLPHSQALFGRRARRFGLERDILAGLTHPNIAQFFDAGTDASGRPYLALEYIDGRPLTEACRIARSTLGERLALLRQVTAAVHYAHGRLVVHRDLKPSNVLVDEEGRVKLLDFGIAKLLERIEDSETQKPVLTVQGEAFFTLEYAAPEQIHHGVITVATDVYAIGVLAFELLTGGRPEHVELRQTFPGRYEGHDAIPLASKSLKTGFAATVGGLGDLALSRSLAGDLDAILAKALAHEPGDRYASVEALDADLERFLRHEPIVARHIGRLAVAGKFVRRHRRFVALSSALALTLLCGVVAFWWQARETARAARRAEATRDFLIGIFRGGDPRFSADKPRSEVTVRELVDQAAADIDRGLANDPLTRIEMLDLIATIYQYLDEKQKALELVRLEIAFAEKILAPDDPQLLDARLFELWSLLQTDDVAAIESALSSLESQLDAAGLAGSRWRAESYLARGDWALIKGDLGAREQALGQAAAIFERVAPHESGYRATLLNLASLAFDRDRSQAALELCDQALATPTDREFAVDRARILGLKGRAFFELGRFAEALATFEQAHELFANTLGADHVSAWSVIAGRARLLCREGRVAEAEALFATIPPSSSGALAERFAEVQLQRGLCLAEQPGSEAAAHATLTAAVVVLGARSYGTADLERGRRALALLEADQ